MKYIYSFIMLVLLMVSCSSTKLLTYEGVIYPLKDMQLRVNINANSKKMPSSPYTTNTTHLISCSLTNLNKANSFEGTRIIDGKQNIASLYIAFRLSNNSLIEHKQPLIGIKISPQITSSEIPLPISIPQNQKIVSIEGVRIEYKDTL